jgi:pimeloyl-ACP methyl ester carboxylesterase
MWENPEVFNTALLEFLRDVDATPATDHRQPTAFSWSIAGVANHIAYRETGAHRDLVLIHGLGMSSAYLGHLASALFDRGLHAVAPDLTEPLGPEEQARVLVDWADALSIRNAIWLGHSLGCNVVAHVARLRPDVVSKAVYVGPLWTHAKHPMLHLLRRLLMDAVREPLSLYAYVIPAYWRTGIARWWVTFHRSVPDIRSNPAIGLMIAGERDPLPDLPGIVRVPGAHACLFSNPAGVAKAITQ